MTFLPGRFPTFGWYWRKLTYKEQERRMNMCHLFCGHETLQDTVICGSCNPHRLSEPDFRLCLAEMIDPRKVRPEAIQALSRAMENARKEKPNEER
jgi:hypothetical protein